MDIGDIGDGPRVSVGGPYRVRCLQGAQAGAVVELSALQCRAESSGDNHYPRFEPVPDNEPLHDPILPPNFPSNYQKAGRIASRALKKSPDEITLEDCIKFFSKSRPAAIEAAK